MGWLEQFDIILEIDARSQTSPLAAYPDLERPVPAFARVVTGLKSVFLSRSDVRLIGEASRACAYWSENSG